MGRLLVGAVLILLAGLGTAGVAAAQDIPAVPEPYGGQLGRMDPGDEVDSEQVLEVGMLALGTINGVAFVVAMVASRLCGPTTAQTRRALIARTGAGTVSESRRARRARAADRARSVAAPPLGVPVPTVPPAAVPLVAVSPAAVSPALSGTPVPSGAPDSVTASDDARDASAPSGAVPAQAPPAPVEGLVPAARAGAAPVPPAPRSLVTLSPPSGVPSPVRR